jgi:uroporphyrinogen decarboxylase
MRIEKPFKKEPDFEHFRKVLLRETTEGPVPIVELLVDLEIMQEATGMQSPIESWVDFANMTEEMDPAAMEAGIELMDLTIAFHKAVGYDYVPMTPLVPLKKTAWNRKENPLQGGKVRGWQEEHSGLITTREAFDTYSWPAMEEISILPIEYTADKIPAGMKQMIFCNGIFEELRNLMGFETMAIKSIEEPGLLVDILENLTVLTERAVDMATAHPNTGAVFYGEDMGFNQGTMLHPDFFREHVLPRHKRIAHACHGNGKPFVFHSCGKIEALLEDLIEEVGIDALHSFQDNITPIEEMHKRYGDRISLLGGVDVDLLARGSTDDVRARARQILEACAPSGGIMLGSGNSVTNYCKIENYYAMIDETRKWNEEQGYP